ncbi:MAG: YbaK/EbsC family protein [Gammaproteobacteria bacterium]|nr:YbaK/EbsC family protein [Gammaproteobacteria bacterium]
MSISKILETYLVERGVKFTLKPHTPTGSSMESAEQAHVSGDALAKGVLVKKGDDYLLVVVPSDYHIDLESLKTFLRQEVELASEEELGSRFSDCELGAAPPLGHAYGIKTIWDPSTSLGREKWIYFEAGDHQNLIKVSGEHFHELMAPAERGVFSYHI